MKNKKLIYVLLPVVLALWGVIMYRIFNYVSGDDENNFAAQPSERILPEKIEKDSFTVIADYRDPFLGRFAVNYHAYEYDNEVDGNPNQTDAEQNEKEKETKEDANENDISIRWPSINYGGIILGLNTKKVVGLVKINNKEFLMSEEDCMAEVVLLALNRDSILVSYKEQHKTVRKSR